MAPASHSKAPPAAQPSRHIFDPFNSSATGHQRAENRLSGSASWRDSRSLKLRAQFSSASGGGGDARLSDTVGAGSLQFGRDGRTANGGFVDGAPGLRGKWQRSLWESMPLAQTKSVEDEDGRARKRVKIEDDGNRPEKRRREDAGTKTVNPWTPFRREDGSVRESSWPSHHARTDDTLPINPCAAPAPFEITSTAASVPACTSASAGLDPAPPDGPPKPQIFAHLTFYINGSTAPYSDHALKRLLSQHGGTLAIALGRRRVTHVVLGTPNAAGGGAGGGLAASKIQKEIGRMRGGAGGQIHFVAPAWIAACVEAGKRVPEGRYPAGTSIAPKGVKGIAGMFTRADAVK